MIIAHKNLEMKPNINPLTKHSNEYILLIGEKYE